MIIKKATADDAEHIFNLVTLLDQEDGTLRDPVMSAEDIKKVGFGTDPMFEAYIAISDNDQLLGGISFFRGYSGWHANAMAVVHMLFVKKDARGKGIAKMLMSKVANEVIDRGWSRLQLCVEEGTEAIKFYESLKMKDCEEKRYEIEGADLMSLANAIKG